MISSVPTWARPAIDNFLSQQTLPGTVRMDLPAEAASDFFATAADQFDAVRARDNGPQDLDPAPGCLRVHLDGTNVDSVIRFEGDSREGTMTAGLYAAGSSDTDTFIFQRFREGAQDTVILNHGGDFSAAHIEPGQGFLLTPA